MPIRRLIGEELRTNKRTSRVVIAEANVLFRQGLKALFAGDTSIQVIGEAADVLVAVNQVESLRPDVLVLSAALVATDSQNEFSLALRRAYNNVQVLLVDDGQTEGSMALSIALGARHLVQKNSGPAHLMAALRTVAFGDAPLNSSGMLPDLQALDLQTAPQRVSAALTMREQEVVRLLAEGKTVRAVAHDLSLSAKTIEAHKLNLMRKLDIHDRASLVAYANRSGLVATAQV